MPSHYTAEKPQIIVIFFSASFHKGSAVGVEDAIP